MFLILLLLFPTPALAQPRTAACTHYASPGGSGSTCTESAPCKIATFVTSSSLARPGATLCLKDGTYTGDQSMINVPESFGGTAESPITIRAINPGKVTIDGQDSLRPVNTNGAWGVIEGINAIRGDNQNIMIRGTHWMFRNILTWNVGNDGDANVQMSGTDNTIEDCGTWGVARKPIAAGASGGERNTIRRCWARWEGNGHPTSNPTNTIEVGYGQNTVTVENSIATWNSQGRVTEPEGIGQILSTQGSKWLGSIFYLTRNDSYPSDVLVFGTTDAGSHAQEGDFNPTSNLIFKHILAYIDPQHSKFGATKALRFAEGTDEGHPPGENNTLTELTTIAGQNNSFSSSFPTSRVQWGRSIAEAIGAGKSIWTDSNAGPGICKRYVRGQLTAQPLWPWPMNQRIKDGLAQSGYPAVDVTATMESLFGAIPAACRTAGPGPGPGPNPPPTVPVPPTNVTATVQASQVTVAWTDTQNTIQTGYAVERATGPAGYVPLAAAIGRDERSFADTQPTGGQTNCYVVYARGPAGPSGFSEPACVAVPQTPRPPEPPAGATPLGCVGLQGEGGGIAIACMPQTPEGRR